jgi:hypothetical protein
MLVDSRNAKITQNQAARRNFGVRSDNVRIFTPSPQDICHSEGRSRLVKEWSFSLTSEAQLNGREEPLFISTETDERSRLLVGRFCLRTSQKHQNGH